MDANSCHALILSRDISAGLLVATMALLIATAVLSAKTQRILIERQGRLDEMREMIVRAESSAMMASRVSVPSTGVACAGLPDGDPAAVLIVPCLVCHDPVRLGPHGRTVHSDFGMPVCCLTCAARGPGDKLITILATP
jgi:hypothetical protein